MGTSDIHVDAAIFGGGVAGLWILDELTRAGFTSLLLESQALGAGQTVWSQGIIHGGLKYTLRGAMTPSAESIRDMPHWWRECLAGRREPRLTQTGLRADHCHLWQTRSLRSAAGMIGARIGLRTAPAALARSDRPAALRECPGVVARLDEPVIDTPSLLADLAGRHEARLLRVAPDGVRFDCASPGRVDGIRLRSPAGEGELVVRTARVVLSAGAGNTGLRAALGLQPGRTQIRPLAMVLARGDLPALNGHCVDGARTRVTITTAADSTGRTVWQIGGQIAEDGVAMSASELTAHARRELAAVLPGVDLARVEWGGYAADRAEPATPDARRPDEATILEEGNVISAWPVKMALAPVLARRVLERFEGDSRSAGGGRADGIPRGWPRPAVASPPWESTAAWKRCD